MSDTLELLLRERGRLSAQTHAKSTNYTYAFAWKKFREWCQANNREPLPASTETVTLYLTHLITSGRKIATAHVRAAGIAHHHKLAGLPAPIGSTQLLTGAQRLLCEQPTQKHPLSVAELRSICLPMSLSDDWLVIRNHAILTLGFASALRRSNLVALIVADLRFTDQGIILHIKREKNDQMGKAGELVVAKQTGHRSLDSLRRYFRATDLFRANVSAGVGL